MFGRRNTVFGKKQQQQSAPRGGVSTNVPQPAKDDDGVTRVMSKEHWGGPQGDFLRKIGVSPDDPSNLAMTQERAEAIFAAKRAEQDAFLESINAKLLDGCKVIPWAMLPWSMWSGPHATFLIGVMQIFPVEPWNTMLLAEDDRTAMMLGLPKHPRGPLEGLEENANHVIGEMRADLDKVHARTMQAVQNGDISTLSGFTDKQSHIKASIMGLSWRIGQLAYGDEAWAHHKDLFGASLGWPGCK